MNRIDFDKWDNGILTSLEIKPCGLGSRILDVEEFWYKTEIKNHLLCAVVLIARDFYIYN